MDRFDAMTSLIPTPAALRRPRGDGDGAVSAASLYWQSGQASPGRYCHSKILQLSERGLYLATKRKPFQNCATLPRHPGERPSRIPHLIQAKLCCNRNERALSKG